LHFFYKLRYHFCVQSLFTFNSRVKADQLDGRAGGGEGTPVPPCPSDDVQFCSIKEKVIHVVRSPGTGLGISIAGGRGSRPYVDDDGVSCFFDMFHLIVV